MQELRFLYKSENYPSVNPLVVGIVKTRLTSFGASGIASFSPLVFLANVSVDGHRSHLTYQLSELCSELDITLLSIHPNATRLVRQLDVATFRPLKLGWKIPVPEWHKKKSDKILNKEWFAPAVVEL
ncbi:hypothetical protein Cfor_06781 [Coptotermes formosanus]|uniref:Uncharacterized protein n=1 Tax=Coptotermes formosanus TaxID=36987 RepID=A0A6L2PFE7_COPFO|nr:hypothetical protein Cfor_06781 [Coptotermes formosanus]